MAHSLAIRLPPMECLEAALAAGRLGSFSAAAEELGVTHATISRRVAGAESWAGFALFERHGRGVRLTFDGQRLLTRLAQTLDELNTVVDRERTPRQRPVVRLSVTPSFARFWLFPRLAELEGDDVRIELVAEHRNVDLERGEADLAVRYGRGGWKTDFEEPLFPQRLTPFANARAFASVAQDGPEAIARLPLIHNGDTDGWRAWCAHYGVTWRRKAGDRVLLDYSLSVDAVDAGLGVALWNTALHPVSDRHGVRIHRSDLTASARYGDHTLGYHLLMRAGVSGGPAGVVLERIRSAVHASGAVTVS